MQFLQKTWAQIQALFANLTLAERWLMATLLVLAGAIIFIVLQYAAAPERNDITAFLGTGPRQAEAIARLQARGIEVTNTGGRVFVSADDQADAISVLTTADLLTGDTSAAFDDLIVNQTWWKTNAQNQQALLLAKQKVLGSIVAKMVGVRNADVLISMPEDRGFGRSTVRPSASVNVVTQGSRSVDKALVEAIAGLVAGAVAEMSPQDVVVVDALQGRQFTVKSAMEALPGDAMELVQKIEAYHHAKIAELLSYIPGVIVAVNVQVDPTQRKQIEAVEYEKTEALRSETNQETESTTTAAGGGAPGARSNTGMGIEGGGGGESTAQKTSMSRSEFNPKNAVRRETSVEAGGVVQAINVTVNVPRSYFVQIAKAGKADAPEPDDAALAPIVQRELAQIQSQVEPLVTAAGGAAGNGAGGATSGVRTHMIPDRSLWMPVTAGVGASSSGVQMVLDNAWAKPAGVALLAAVSLAIMLVMARKATQTQPMPSIEELAGVPPTLQSDDDLVGEAETGDSTMPGMELDDEELRHRKIAEQITELIKSNPAEAAGLVRKWVRTEE